MKERICPKCGGDLIYLEELNEIICDTCDCCEEEVM